MATTKLHTIWNSEDTDSDISFDDERDNLNQPVNGDIVAIADLGLWNGRHMGYKIVGKNVRDILHTHCGEFVKYYCDRYDVKCNDTHHDGTNYYTFRLLKKPTSHSRGFLEKLKNGTATKADITRHTKSLRPYVANVYGW